MFLQNCWPVQQHKHLKMHSVHAIQVNTVISMPKVKHTDCLGQHTDRAGIMEIVLDFFVVRTKKAPKMFALLNWHMPMPESSALHGLNLGDVFYCNYIRKTHPSLTNHRCIVLTAISSTDRLSEQLPEILIRKKTVWSSDIWNNWF